MNLLFLGTSAGVPTKTRNVSGVALRESKGKGWYLIDCGERPLLWAAGHTGECGHMRV